MIMLSNVWFPLLSSLIHVSLPMLTSTACVEPLCPGVTPFYYWGS